MELPSELLAIVREFSKPLFRYRDEYEEVVQMTQNEWPELKTKLTGPDADRIGDCLQAYIVAYGDNIKAENAFEKLKCDWAQAGVPNTDTVRTYAYWDKYGDLKHECRHTLIHEMALFEELQILVDE